MLNRTRRPLDELCSQVYGTVKRTPVGNFGGEDVPSSYAPTSKRIPCGRGAQHNRLTRC